MLNFIKYLLIIFLNSGLYYSFSMEFSDTEERELQSVYRKYEKSPHNTVKVPKNLCDLYDFHKTHILGDYKGYYANKESNNQKISEVCYLDTLLVAHDSYKERDGVCYLDALLVADDSYEESDIEILSTIRNANLPPFPPHLNMDFKVSGHPSSGHSGAEIYILHGNSERSTKIAKIFRSQSAEELKQGFLELSNSLIALSLNPDFVNINMTRVLSAGYTYFRDTEKPYVFCMLLEKARGKSIKELLHSKFIDHPDGFGEVLIDSGQFLAYFHVKSYHEFIKSHTIDADVKNAEIKDREKFCRRRISVLLQDLGFNSRSDTFFNFKDALKSIEGILDQGVQPFSKKITNQEPTGEPIAFGRHLTDILSKFEKWELALEDRVITHGDMHIGNLCYKAGHNIPPLHRLTMIDFSSIKRTYGAIGDPAQDVGKFIGSIWKEIALSVTQVYGDKEGMETWYNILCKWQETFISAYIEAYAQEEAKLHEKSTDHIASAAIYQESFDSCYKNKMANFRERVYFYKLCLYAQFFDDIQIGAEIKDIVKAKQLLFYFLLREVGLLGAGNLDLQRTDPVRSTTKFLAEFSLARTGPTGNTVIGEGSCLVLHESYKTISGCFAQEEYQ